ncbi:FixH family protein [Neobacillus sp. D3-1R]|uniref:FixH family protein n=1 Tax=Neobacillus sp. D3-1R TaxID=3445778 RepID=UPI003F9FE401
MKKAIIAVILLIGIMAGCASQNEQEHQNGSRESLEIIEVTIQTPETINPNEEVTIKALVTQGNEKVDDANEVKFEVWKDGQEEHEMLKGANEGKGIYSIKKTFTENGKYYVISHVTARSMHAMPKKEFVVGTVEEHDHEAAENHEDDHGHHDGSIEIEMAMDPSYVINKETSLKTTVKHEDALLKGARVRYEIISHDDSNNVEWLEAKEEGDGIYSATTSFKQQGTYHIQIHVNKEDQEIHEHKVIMIDVK